MKQRSLTSDKTVNRQMWRLKASNQWPLEKLIRRIIIIIISKNKRLLGRQRILKETMNRPTVNSVLFFSRHKLKYIHEKVKKLYDSPLTSELDEASHSSHFTPKERPPPPSTLWIEDWVTPIAGLDVLMNMAIYFRLLESKSDSSIGQPTI